MHGRADQVGWWTAVKGYDLWARLHGLSDTARAGHVQVPLLQQTGGHAAGGVERPEQPGVHVSSPELSQVAQPDIRPVSYK